MTKREAARIFSRLILTAAAGIAAVYAQTGSGDATLKEQLEATNRGFSERADPAIIQSIDAAVTEVDASGILDGAVKLGDTAPDFTLPDAIGNMVTLSKLLKEGPVVLTWYRGNW